MYIKRETKMIITEEERDDWYCCWIEEIDMFNE